MTNHGWRRLVVTLLGIGLTAACSSVSPNAGRVADAQLPIPPESCTAALLATTPAYDPANVLALVGRYRWVWVDTVSARRLNRLPEGEREHAKPRVRQFHLWRADTTSARASAPPLLRRRQFGPIAGAMEDADTTGLSPSRPQLEVLGTRKHYLYVAHDPRASDSVVDGGDVVDDLPIEVLGAWGFGGYYQQLKDFYRVDLDGKRIPSFAGYYCALRR